MKGDSIRTEAIILGRYLVGTRPSGKVLALYAQAITAKPGMLTVRDKKLLAYMQKHPRAVGLVDAGLSLLDTNSEIRRRIHLIFSILESMPEYHEHFLSRHHSRWYIFVIAGKGVWGVAKTVIGSAFIKVVVR